MTERDQWIERLDPELATTAFIKDDREGKVFLDSTRAYGATVAAALTPATAAVVHVHVAGLVAPAVEEVRALCDSHGIVLVEDAAHAVALRRTPREKPAAPTFAGLFVGQCLAVSAVALALADAADRVLRPGDHLAAARAPPTGCRLWPR